MLTLLMVLLLLLLLLLKPFSAVLCVCRSLDYISGLESNSRMFTVSVTGLLELKVRNSCLDNHQGHSRLCPLDRNCH